MAARKFVDRIDYRLLASEPDRFARKFGSSLRRSGFAVLTCHPISRTLIDESYWDLRRLFEFPAETLQMYEFPDTGRQTGYTPIGLETAKGAATPDRKHFWQVGPVDVEPGHPLYDNPTFTPNVWPSEVCGFEAHMTELYRRLYDVAMALLGSLGSYLRLNPKNLLAEAAQGGRTILRAIHYPPPNDSDDRRSVPAAAHEDINFLTLLIAATGPGLQVLNREGAGARWTKVGERMGDMVVNAGDMLQTYTAMRLRSTTHRVAAETDMLNTHRWSMPFFVHARDEFVINPRSGLTVREALLRRLRENGVA